MTELDDIRHLLPQRTAELADVIGLQAALKLVKLRGGRRLYVPKTATEDHWLVEHIGLDVLQKLAKYYARNDLEIDRCAGLRRAVIVAEYERGVPVSVLAEKNNCTERAVRYMTIAAMKQPKRPLKAELNLDWLEEFL